MITGSQWVIGTLLEIAAVVVLVCYRRNVINNDFLQLLDFNCFDKGCRIGPRLV